MNQIDSIEGRILFIIYNLYKSNTIDMHQRNEFKDLLIIKDARMNSFIEAYKVDQNAEILEANLISLTADSSPIEFDDQSSLNYTYKLKRPQRFNFPQNTVVKMMESIKQSRKDTDSISRNSKQNIEHYPLTRKRIYSVIDDYI